MWGLRNSQQALSATIDMPVNKTEDVRTSRRRFLFGLAAVATQTALLTGCQPSNVTEPRLASGSTEAKLPESGRPATRASSKPDGWDELVSAARREATVVLHGSGGAEGRAAYVDSFERAYPGIKVQGNFGPSPAQVAQVNAERAAGKYLLDVWINGPVPFIAQMKPVGALAPLLPQLVLPEVVDMAGWLDGHLWWNDDGEPYTTLQFRGQVYPAAYYNKNLVDPVQFKSYWDFLDPKWKGKIAATDIRSPGPGTAFGSVMYKQEQVGSAFFQRLYGEMNVVLSKDQRQIVDWLAQGKYPIALFASTQDVVNAEEQGLPVGAMPGEQFKEGAILAPSSGCFAVLDRAPHPNAAKLYANWLLSREGQTAVQRETRQPSLRVDLPPQERLIGAPHPGVKYFNFGSPEYAKVTDENLVPLITEALRRAGLE